MAAAVTVAAGMATPAPAQTTLILTTMSPGSNDIGLRYFRPWADRMVAASNAQIAVDVRDGFALANFGNVFDRVMNDIVQIGWGMQGLVGGRFPLTEVATFPFQADNAEQASTALWRLYAAGDLGDEYRDLKPLVLGTYPMNGVHYAKKPASFQDFSGLKLRAASKPQGEWIARLGGAPISMGAEDLYPALQRGTIDATLQAWTTFGPYKLAEVTSYHLDVKFGTSTIMLFMTKKKFDALPAVAQKGIEDNSGERMSREWGRYYDETAAKIGASVLAMPNHHAQILDAAQLAAWGERVRPVEEAWVETHPAGQALLAKYRAQVAAVKAGR
jgi:TRAP-type C4-dicarboxylate transport system substrate-binding protein